MDDAVLQAPDGAAVKDVVALLLRGVSLARKATSSSITLSRLESAAISAGSEGCAAISVSEVCREGSGMR